MADSNAKKLAQFLTSSGTYNLYDVQADSTGFFDLPTGTTAQRPTATSGMIRYNSTNNLAEYYDGNQWKSIDAPPVVSSISPTTETDANANITISGSNFQSGATVKFVGNDGTEYSSPSVTFNNVSELVATTPATALSVANEPYDVKVENPSGLSATLGDALDAGGVPAFTTSAGTVNIYDSARSSSFDAGATDPDGDTITYSVSSGSLPTGASLNTSTGEITGFSAVGSDTASTFTISAATASDTSTRTWTLNVKAPVLTSYTSTGSGTFSVPTGLTAVDVLVVGGGGSGSRYCGGGAGGLIYRPSFPVTPGGSISYTVGSGGLIQPQTFSGPQNGNKGGNSTFGGLTALGGGGGKYHNTQGGPDSVQPVQQGGSGAGGDSNPGSPPNNLAGDGQQPSQPGDSGTYGFGNPGGTGQQDGTYYSGGGGGGAGAVGGSAGGGGYSAGQGGSGKQYDISGSQVYYAGGGGGAFYAPNNNNSGAGGQGGGGNGGTNIQIESPQTAGSQAGTANRGGGGGGGVQPGGSGIVIVSY